MDVSHVILIVQMVPNRAKHHYFPPNLPKVLIDQKKKGKLSDRSKVLFELSVLFSSCKPL